MQTWGGLVEDYVYSRKNLYMLNYLLFEKGNELTDPSRW